MIIVIVGVTGSGKSEAAISLAKRIGGEVVNGDAFQVYQELNIATCKPSKEMMKEVPHHLFDFVPLGENYDVAAYQKDMREAISDILGRGAIPIIAGGTGLYIRAGLYDYDFSALPESDPSRFDDWTNEELRTRLWELDPVEAEKIHPNNRHRLIRALEICEATGSSKTSFLALQRHEPIYGNVFFFGLERERESSYSEADRRVDLLFEKGLVGENKRLIEKYGYGPRAFKAIGVKELFPYFEGKKSLEECKEDIKLNTRHYIKRQNTFFAHQFKVEWVDGFEQILEEIA